MHRTILLALGLLAVVTARAETVTVLESFETDIAAATLVTSQGGRASLQPPGVILRQYAKAVAADNNVSDGSKSLQVTLSGKEIHSVDFQIQLSAETSAKIRQAAASRDVARYILRYDVIFPPMNDFVYFSSALHFGDSRDVLVSSGGKRTMSVALDLLTGLPTQGNLKLVIADDFDFKPDFTNVTLYVDNIRLVDNYAPGTQPVTYVLQSFEDGANPTGGAANFTDWDNDKPITRTAFAQYTASQSQDICVTEGKHSLQVSNSNPGFWHADFTLPLNKTKLAEILKLDEPEAQRPAQEQLARYTLRWDVTYPELSSDWMNSTYHTLETFLPIIQVRHAQIKSRRLTYSVTLDETQWGNLKDAFPTLMFITEGPQKARDVKVYYDNFRLIDTGAAAAPDATKIAATQKSAAPND